MADGQNNSADDLLNSIKGVFTGDNVHKTFSDAWDRFTKGNTTSGDSDESKAQSQKMNDDAVQKANDSFKHPTQTKAQARPAVAAKVTVKTSTKPSPRKQ